MKDGMSQHNITYQNDIQHSYMVIKLLPLEEIIDYQVRMIQENPARQLLPIIKKQIDNEVYLFYDITSKITLAQLLKRIKINKHEFLSMLKSLVTGLRLENEYLLQGGCFMLHSDFIYVDPVTLEFSIAYVPIAVDSDINADMKNWLMELVIYKVSFVTPEQGDLVYELLNLLKSESFCLNQLDKAIGRLAIHEKHTPMENSLRDISPKTNIQSLAITSKAKESSNHNKKLIFIFLQIFFIAIAAFIIRYFYIQSHYTDVTKVAGATMILIAIDILLIKKLTLLSKEPRDTKTSKKTRDTFKGLIGKAKKQVFKERAIASMVESAAAQEPMAYKSPSEFETKVLLDDTDYIPYLLGFGENNNEKISFGLHFYE